MLRTCSNAYPSSSLKKGSFCFCYRQATSVDSQSLLTHSDTRLSTFLPATYLMTSFTNLSTESEIFKLWFFNFPIKINLSYMRWSIFLHFISGFVRKKVDFFIFTWNVSKLLLRSKRLRNLFHLPLPPTRNPLCDCREVD